MFSDVSVIIPCFRCARTLGRAVDSVALQTHPVLEIILIEDYSLDGGSTLAAMHAAKAAHDNVQILIIELKKNVGPGGARNAGWAVARGGYIAFLDADDSWHPRKIEIQLTWLRAHPHATLVGAKSALHTADQSLPSFVFPICANKVAGAELLRSNCFPTRTVMLRRDVEFRFDPIKRYAEDYFLWLLVVLNGKPSYVIDLPLAYTYKPEYGASGLTANLWKMESGEIDAYLRISEGGLIPKVYCYVLILYSLARFLRRVIWSAWWRIVSK